MMVMIVVLVVSVNEAHHLSYGHYKTSCPNVEALVKDTLAPILATDATAPASFLRLMFHDCQIQILHPSAMHPPHPAKIHCTGILCTQAVAL